MNGERRFSSGCEKLRALSVICWLFENVIICEIYERNMCEIQIARLFLMLIQNIFFVSALWFLCSFWDLRSMRLKLLLNYLIAAIYIMKNTY